MNSNDISSLELNKKLAIPGYAFVAYIYITFILAVVGPFDYVLLNPGKVFFYLTYVLVCFIAGYSYSFKKPFPTISLIKPGGKVWFLLSVAFGVGAVCSVLFNSGSTVSLAAAMADPGTAYKEAIMAARTNNNTAISLAAQIQTLTYGLTVCAVAAACVRPKSYPRWMVLFALCFPMLNVALAARIGTFKFAGDWLVFAITIFSLAESKALSRRNKVLAILAIVLFLSAHIYSQESRKMAYGAAVGFPYLQETVFRNDNIVAKTLGPVAYDELASPIFYITNGYAGLSAALDQDFVWTYGVGNSMALQGYLKEYFDIDITPKTYITRATENTGWPAPMYWSTVFPWFASDLTFAGCGILFGFIGYVYPRIFYRAYISRCPLSTSLLFYLNVLLIFAPCTNELMQMRQTMIAFIGTALLYWMISWMSPEHAFPEERPRFRTTRWMTPKPIVRPE